MSLNHDVTAILSKVVQHELRTVLCLPLADTEADEAAARLTVALSDAGLFVIPKQWLRDLADRAEAGAVKP